MPCRVRLAWINIRFHFFCPLSSKVLNVPFFRCCVLFLRCICVVIFSMLSIEGLYFLSHHFIIKYHISCPFSSYSSILTAGYPLRTTTNHPAPERETPPPGRIYCYLTTCPPPEEAREKIMKKKKKKKTRRRSKSPRIWPSIKARFWDVSWPETQLGVLRCWPTSSRSDAPWWGPLELVPFWKKWGGWGWSA